MKTYFSQCPWGEVEFPSHPQRDAKHGGQSQDPADAVPPPRVDVLVVILQWGVLDQCKGEGSLRDKGGHINESVRVKTGYKPLGVDIL